MKKIVNFCGNCPFMYSEYDSATIGDCYTDICVLANHLNKKDYIIASYDDVDITEGNGTPLWCPLQEEKVELEFNPFSKKRSDEINEVKKELFELTNELEQAEINENIEDDDKRYDKISELNDKLSLLFNNEGVSDEYITDELKNSVDEIKVQIEEMLKVSEKIGETFKNLGSEEN